MLQDPPGKIQSFYRNCENKPTHMNTIISDDFFITYYTACKKDYCNGGNGKDMGDGGNFDDGYGGYGVLKVPGISSAHQISVSSLTILAIMSLVLYYNY